ncbi:MAG TPA: lysylphosphatidylglycerol synthase domain-containing protein, partial [Chloroflexota bacterium]|nr:lysylphosphatidylglycerol synthase domain-containing protein [Chloroflexota bacterium]
MAGKRRGGTLKKLVRSFLLTLLMLAVLGALLWFGNAHKVITVIARFKHIYLLWFVLLLLAQEVLRWLLWTFLLQALGTRVPPRIQLLAFAAGEAAKFLPTGAYLQNYLLQRATGTDFGRSSAATTFMIVGEIAAALLGFVILGVGAWSTWLRVAILVAAIIAGYLIRIYLVAPHTTRIPRWMRGHSLLVQAFGELERFRAGAAALTDWRIVGITMGLCAMYVLTSGA